MTSFLFKPLSLHAMALVISLAFPVLWRSPCVYQANEAPALSFCLTWILEPPEDHTEEEEMNLLPLPAITQDSTDTPSFQTQENAQLPCTSLVFDQMLYMVLMAPHKIYRLGAGALDALG